MVSYLPEGKVTTEEIGLPRFPAYDNDEKVPCPVSPASESCVVDLRPQGREPSPKGPVAPTGESDRPGWVE